jgi:hypothetical protein
VNEKLGNKIGIDINEGSIFSLPSLDYSKGGNLPTRGRPNHANFLELIRKRIPWGWLLATTSGVARRPPPFPLGDFFFFFFSLFLSVLKDFIFQIYFLDFD